MTYATVGQESMSVPGSWYGKTCGESCPRQAAMTSGVSSKRSSASSPPVLLFLDLTGGGQWDKSGCIMGKDFSIAWRLFDAQYWGVPQRRERVALVADFAGVSAPEIVFDCDSGVIPFSEVRPIAYGVSGDAASSGTKRQGTAEAAETDTNSSSAVVYDARGNGDGEICPTLTGDHENRITDYTAICCGDKVRWLTPLECERLQGFPDNWTLIGKPSDLVIRYADYDPSVSWVEAIYKYMGDDGKTHKVTDSARYKALGNSIAIPSWYQLFKRLSAFCKDDRTLGSLFDGVGGFPFIWASLHGQDACIWASEIEPFAIAVTKQHFPERGKQ